MFVFVFFCLTSFESGGILGKIEVDRMKRPRLSKQLRDRLRRLGEYYTFKAVAARIAGAGVRCGSDATLRWWIVGERAPVPASRPAIERVVEEMEAERNGNV